MLQRSRLLDHICVVSEPNPWKIGGRVWDIGWYGIVPSGMYEFVTIILYPLFFWNFQPNKG